MYKGESAARGGDPLIRRPNGSSDLFALLDATELQAMRIEIGNLARKLGVDRFYAIHHLLPRQATLRIPSTLTS